MELIDKDALIKELGIDRECECCQYVAGKYLCGCDMPHVDFCEAIVEAPTIEVPEWIPCSERLPKRQGYYICTCKDGSKYKRTTTVKWSNGWQLAGARAYWIVLAWMPLPEPWKGADDEID